MRNTEHTNNQSIGATETTTIDQSTIKTTDTTTEDGTSKTEAADH